MLALITLIAWQHINESFQDLSQKMLSIFSLSLMAERGNVERI